MRFAVYFLAALLFGCTSSNTSIDQIKKLKQINYKVARDNRCRLTSVITTADGERHLELILESKHSDELLPGKILIEFYEQLVPNVGFSVDKFSLKKQNVVILKASSDAVAQLTEKVKVYSELAAGMQNDKSTVYAHFSAAIREKMTLEQLDAQLSALQLANVKFCGFVYSEALIGMGFENDENRIYFVIDPNSDKVEILGMHIK